MILELSIILLYDIFIASKINLGDDKEFMNLSKKYSVECFF